MNNVVALSRQTLVRAYLALGRNASAFVLIGAHAVYLRSPVVIANMDPFTSDAGFLGDLNFIDSPRAVLESMERHHFRRRSSMGGFFERNDVVSEDLPATKIDLFRTSRLLRFPPFDEPEFTAEPSVVRSLEDLATRCGEAVSTSLEADWM